VTKRGRGVVDSVSEAEGIEENLIVN